MSVRMHAQTMKTILRCNNKRRWLAFGVGTRCKVESRLQCTIGFLCNRSMDGLAHLGNDRIHITGRIARYTFALETQLASYAGAGRDRQLD